MLYVISSYGRFFVNQKPTISSSIINLHWPFLHKDFSGSERDT